MIDFGFYAPAGFATDPAAIDRAAARLEALGHRVVVDPTARGREQRFSADDDERLTMQTRERELLMAHHGRLARDPWS